MLTNRILCYWVPNKIPIRLEGLHTGLQLQAVQARPDRALIGTAVDPLKPFIDGLVMSRPKGRLGSGRSQPRGRN
jgi:hypothetical protein